ncbi:MAG: Rap1a/Tai family immunity protein [Rhodocyclaceae bacterium]
MRSADGALRSIRQGLAVNMLALGMLTASEGTLALTPPPTMLDPNNVDLSGGEFLAAYTHSEFTYRERAQLYLLGVMDAGEGRSWCSYRVAKTVSLHEVVFEYFRKLPATRLQLRASLLINEALRTALPCKVK